MWSCSEGDQGSGDEEVVGEPRARLAELGEIGEDRRVRLEQRLLVRGVDIAEVARPWAGSEEPSRTALKRAPPPRGLPRSRRHCRSCRRRGSCSRTVWSWSSPPTPPRDVVRTGRAGDDDVRPDRTERGEHLRLRVLPKPFATPTIPITKPTPSASPSAVRTVRPTWRASSSTRYPNENTSPPLIARPAAARCVAGRSAGWRQPPAGSGRDYCARSPLAPRPPVPPTGGPSRCARSTCRRQRR